MPYGTDRAGAVRNISFVGQSMAKRVLCDNNHVDTGCRVVYFPALIGKRILTEKIETYHL